MEEHCNHLSWPYNFQQEGVEELKRSLLYSNLELEAAVIASREEILRKDYEILQLKGLLDKIIKERDEFETKFKQGKKLRLHQVQVVECPFSSGTTSNENDENTLSPLNCCDHIIIASSHCKNTLPLTINKALPEQGKFLQAVMEAGPLLHTLLLTGPLPRWQHPLPHQDSCMPFYKWRSN